MRSARGGHDPGLDPPGADPVVEIRGNVSMRGLDARALPFELPDDDPPALSLAALEPPSVRALFAAGHAGFEPEIRSDRAVDHPPPRPAAVLVALLEGEGGQSVLLTRRPSHLRAHSGQIAFPGGRAEPADADRRMTALREAHEEVGLPPDAVDVIGMLPEYLTASGFAITPVIGAVRGRPALVPDPAEVDEIFEVPLGWLMDARNHQRRRILFEGRERVIYAMPWQPASTPRVEYFIWGVTAAILRNLYLYLRHASSSPMNSR